METFALFRDGVFTETRRRPERPEDLPQKSIKWYPLGTQKIGSPVGWKIVSGKAVETVAPAPAPSTDPNDYPLQPFQFEAMLEILDKTAAVDVAIDAISDINVRAVARAKRRAPPNGFYNRSDSLFTSLAPAVGLTDAEIDAAWMTAKDIV